jgi:hypothetical protein
VFIFFQFLHVLTMFAAVAAALIPEVVLHVMARRGDVPALRGFLPIAQRVGKTIPILFVVGLVFGIIAAIAGDIDLLRPWLIGSYVVFAIAMATGALLSEPWAQRLAVTAFASPLDAPSDELRAATHDTRGFAASTILMTSIVVIVFLMVAKPGG